MPHMEMDLEQPRGPGEPSLMRAMQVCAIGLGAVLALMWGVFLVDVFCGHALSRHGIVPRTIGSLPAIFFAPFLHASLSHIVSNTTGMVLLGGLLMLRNPVTFWTVSVLGMLGAGLGTWVIGRGNAVHIGASGVIFAYFGYLLAAGIFERKLSSILLSLLTFFLWGGMLWQTLPLWTMREISWEGHLTGLVTGIAAAKLLAEKKGRPTSELSPAVPEFRE